MHRHKRHAFIATRFTHLQNTCLSTAPARTMCSYALPARPPIWRTAQPIAPCTIHPTSLHGRCQRVLSDFVNEFDNLCRQSDATPPGKPAERNLPSENELE